MNAIIKQIDLTQLGVGTIALAIIGYLVVSVDQTASEFARESLKNQERFAQAMEASVELDKEHLLLMQVLIDKESR